MTKKEDDAKIIYDKNDILENSDIIGDVLESILVSTNDVLRYSVVEFLTINFYKFLITDLNILFKFQIYSFLIAEKLPLNKKSKQEIISNLEVIEYNTKKLILDKNFKRYFIHHYRYILNRETELFQRSILADVEKKLHTGIDQMLGIKNPKEQNIVDDYEEYDGIYPYESCVYSCMNRIPLVNTTAIYCPQLLYDKPLQSNKRTFCGTAKIDGSFANKLVKSLTGLIGAVPIVFMLYLFIRYFQNTSVYIGVIIICGLGAIIIFGLTFNSTIRAFILLMFPFVASLQGRLLLSYFALKRSREYIYGNYEINWRKLKFTFTCMKKIIYDQIVKMSNLDGFIGFIFKSIKIIINFCEWALEAIETVKRFLGEIFGYIKEAVKLITLLMNACSNNFGLPMIICFEMINEWETEKCGQNVNLGYASCVAPYYILRLFCIALLAIQFICTLTKMLFKGILYAFKLMVSSIWNALFGSMFGSFEDIFDIHFNASRSYHYYESQDRSLMSVVSAIGEDYSMKIKYLITVLQEIDYFFPVLIIYLIYESWSYWHSYLNHIEFDNFVYSANFEKIDKKRYLRNYRTLLPLSDELRIKYTGLGSTNKTKSEKKKTSRAITMFILVLIPIIYMMGMDQLMIFVYSFVIKHAYVKTNFDNLVPGNTKLSLHIEGEGFMSKIYRFLFDRFSNVAKSNITIDTTECCPPVSKMNTDEYILVGITLSVLLVASCLNSYILRMRSVLLGSVYKQRDNERAIWLYNHLIIKERDFFFSPLAAIRQKNKKPNFFWYYFKKFLNCINDTILGLLSCCWTIIDLCWKLCAMLPCWTVCCTPCYYITTKFCEMMCVPPCCYPSFYIKPLKKLITYLCLKLNPISCEFCKKHNIMLEFQTCLNEKCQKVFCFECYSRFYNECPFCILRSKDKGDEDEDVESLEADSSDEEIVNSTDKLKNDFDEKYVRGEDEENETKSLIEKNSLKKKQHNNNDEDDDDEEEIDEEENLSYAIKEDKSKVKLVNENKAKSFVETLYGSKRLHIKILNSIQDKKFQRSILKPTRDSILDMIDYKSEMIFDLLQSKSRYEYAIINFKKLILGKKEIHDLFNRYSIDVYNEVSETIFDNIVNEIELDEYFSVNSEIKKDKVFKYLNDIFQSMKKDKKKL